MLRVSTATPLDGRRLRLTLSDKSVVERDIMEFISWGEVYERLRSDDDYFRRVRVRYGTVNWPGDVDLAPEILIWNGPDPAEDDPRRPPAFMVMRSPNRTADGDLLDVEQVLLSDGARTPSDLVSEGRST
jgi:hypothetical protein